MNLPPGDLESFANEGVENFTKNYIERSNRSRIRVASDILGVSKWQEMINATQTNFKERGLVLARGLRGGVMTSSMKEGTEEDVMLGVFPHGIKTFLTRSEGSVQVHTHPIRPEIDHLRTTVLSDQDIQVFVNSNYHASVMLDRGGAHLLVRTGPIYAGLPPVVPPHDLVENIKKEILALKDKGRTIDMVKKVAESLPRYGLGYFYRPFYPPFPSVPQQGEAFVEFQNAASANLYPEE